MFALYRQTVEVFLQNLVGITTWRSPHLHSYWRSKLKVTGSKRWNFNFHKLAWSIISIECPSSSATFTWYCYSALNCRSWWPCDVDLAQFVPKSTGVIFEPLGVIPEPAPICTESSWQTNKQTQATKNMTSTVFAEERYKLAKRFVLPL